MSKFRSFVFTHQNWTEQSKSAIMALDCKYMIFGREVAPSTGTPHLQGYIVFSSQRSFASITRLFTGLIQAHVEVAKGDAASNIEYVTKEDPHAYEKGTRPCTQVEKGAKGAAKIKEMWEYAKKGEYEKLPLSMIKTAEYVHAKYGPKCSDRDELDNIWIWGRSGVGKSSYIRRTYPVFYTKSMSKWWDGYDGEETVVLDDFAPEHAKYLTHNLKIWTDHYVIQAEVKGGMLKIRPKTFIITSQYPIEACWDDFESIEALRRRFRVVNLVRSEAERVARLPSPGAVEGRSDVVVASYANGFLPGPVGPDGFERPVGRVGFPMAVERPVAK